MKRLRKYVGIIVALVGLAASMYIGIWKLLIFPAIKCCRDFFGGALTLYAIGVAVLKCLSSLWIWGVLVNMSIVIAAIIIGQE